MGNEFVVVHPKNVAVTNHQSTPSLEDCALCNEILKRCAPQEVHCDVCGDSLSHTAHACIYRRIK